MNRVSSDPNPFRQSVVQTVGQKASLWLTAFTVALSYMAVVAHAEPTFYTYKDGLLEERNTMRLVSPSTTGERLRSRWPRGAITNWNRGPRHFGSFSVQHANAKPEDLAKVLQHANDTLTDLSAGSGSPEASGVEDVLRFRHALDIIQALGSVDDEKRLLQIGLTQDRDIGEPVHTLSAAFGSALRRDALDTSPTLEAWKNRTGSPEFQASLTLALARWGYAPAHDRLIEVVAFERQSELFDRFSRLTAFETITTREHPAVTELVRDFLAAQSEWRQPGAAYAPIETVDGLGGPKVFADALLYAHAYFKGVDRQLLNGPAAQLGYSWVINPMLPFLADARVGALSLFSASEGWDAEPDFGNITRPEFLMRYLCDLRATTDLSRDVAAMQDIVDTYTAWHMKTFIPPSVDYERVRRAGANLRRRISLLDCAPQTVGFGDLDADPLEVATTLPSYMRAAADPVWHVHNPYSGGPRFNFVVLDDLDAAAFQNLADNPAIAGNTLWQEAAVRRDAITAAHFGYPSLYAGEDDRRYFLKAGKETGVREVYIGGKVDFRPRQTSSGTLFGIRLAVQPFVRNRGFAPVPAEIIEQLEFLLKGGGKALIDEVRLRHGENSTPLAYQRASSDGTLVFVLSQPINRMDNLVVDVQLAFYKTSLTLSFPIYASPFGYQRLLNNGRVEVQPWQ